MSTTIEVSTTPDSHGRRYIRGAEAPAELLAELASAEWQGPRMEAFEADLWIYGWDVLRGLVKTGKIRTIPAHVPAVALTTSDWATLAESDEERGELVIDTLGRSVPKFVEVLRAGKYDPTKGSLGTYFIGQCGIQFRDVAKSWQTSQHRRLYELANFDWEEVFGGIPSEDIDRRLDMRRLVANILRGVTAPQRAVLVRSFLEDRSHGEIGDLMGITPRAVEGHVYRAKRAAHSCVSPSHARWVLDGDGGDSEEATR